jgi:hypothetical protein
VGKVAYGYRRINKDADWAIEEALHLCPFIFQTRIIQKKELAIVNNFG